jgi:hypothetical protein
MTGSPTRYTFALRLSPMLLNRLLMSQKRRSSTSAHLISLSSAHMRSLAQTRQSYDLSPAQQACAPAVAHLPLVARCVSNKSLPLAHQADASVILVCSSGWALIRQCYKHICTSGMFCFYFFFRIFNVYLQYLYISITRTMFIEVEYTCSIETHTFEHENLRYHFINRQEVSKS